MRGVHTHFLSLRLPMVFLDEEGFPSTSFPPELFRALVVFTPATCVLRLQPVSFIVALLAHLVFCALRRATYTHSAPSGHLPHSHPVFKRALNLLYSYRASIESSSFPHSLCVLTTMYGGRDDGYPARRKNPSATGPPVEAPRCRESRNDSGSFGRPSSQLAAPSAAPGTTAGSDQEAGADTARSSGLVRGTRRRLTERSPRGPTGPEPPPVRV
jgi:hypothetical protein